jgi:thiol-disulfide isomerase/thioredoxin
MLHTRLLSLITLSAFLCSHVYAEATLGDIKPGSYVNGPAIDAADLKNRVVLFEFWGVNCPPCIASIPHISDLQEKYGRDQLVIIASQCQPADEAKARSVFKNNSGSDLISVINRGGIDVNWVGENGAKGNGGLPNCYLFNHEGKLIFHGKPTEIDKLLEDAVKQNPGFLVAGRKFEKTQKQAAVIGALKTNLSSSLKSLRGLAAGDNAVAKEEAEYLLNKVSDYSKQTMEKIVKARTEKPLEASQLVTRMENLLKGDELGNSFVDLAKELKKDKVFQAELAAGAQLEVVIAQAAKAGLGPDSAKENKPVASQIADALKNLVKKFPNTKAANEATKLVTEWQL